MEPAIPTACVVPTFRSAQEYLSVVDCFDALTSDRPYRPRMADADAIRILLARRGSMYDPLIVDTFIAIHTASAQNDGAHEHHGLVAEVWRT